MGLRKYLAKRVLYTLALIFLVVCFNYFLFQVLPFTTSCPHGFTYEQCAESLYLPTSPPHGSGSAQAEIIAKIRAAISADFGFSQPLLTRIALYIKDMFTFNFGYNVGSSASGPVLSTIELKAPYTLLLIGTSTIAAFIIGIGMGIVAAAKRGKAVDLSSLAALLWLSSLPVFFLGAVLEVVQASVTGHSYLNVGVETLQKTGWAFDAGVLKAFFLPFLTLTLVGIGGVFLTERAVMIDTVAEDYIQIARAKGLPERTVLFKHAFRNAVLPIFTAFALSIGFILSGAVITETVFGFPGLGLALYEAVITYDFPLEQAMFFIISAMVIISVLVADLTYGFLDPRVSTG